MNNQPDTREVIPGGRQQFGWEHLVPIAKLLIERGHLPIDEESKFGFGSSQIGTMCALGRKFTDEDWVAINERFVIPANVVYFHGLIRDNANRVDMMGWDELHETLPVEVRHVDWVVGVVVGGLVPAVDEVVGGELSGGRVVQSGSGSGSGSVAVMPVGATHLSRRPGRVGRPGRR